MIFANIAWRIANRLNFFHKFLQKIFAFKYNLKHFFYNCVFNFDFLRNEIVFFVISLSFGSIAQSVEQRTENPRVGGSIPPRATITKKFYKQCF